MSSQREKPCPVKQKLDKNRAKSTSNIKVGNNERAELPAVEAQRLLQLRYLQPVSTFRQGGTMARPLSLCATAGASRHPVLPYTPDSENLLSAAECSGGLTLLRLRPLATEREPFFRFALHFLIKAKHEHGATLPDCECN